MKCVNCGAPERKLWVAWGEHHRPDLTDVASEPWSVLRRCVECGSFWCLTAYEPFASFPFLASWPHGQGVWQRTQAIDDGKTLSGWHARMVAKHYRELPPDELQQVEWWRRRSYGHNPIDSGYQFHFTDIPDVPANT